MQQQVIHIHPRAPQKPAEGTPCNGCGVCCMLEPCPIGVLVSRRIRGECKALAWSDQAGRYHCGVLAKAYEGARPGVDGRKASIWRRAWWRWVHRMIAAGVGCDAALQTEREMPQDK